MSTAAIDAELVLKSTPPRMPKGLLVRGRLSCDGEEFRDKAVIEVNAPAGFGKTSLLVQWRREALNRGALTAWLTLDDRDDGIRFLHGLAHSMRVASGRSAFELVAQLTSQRGNALEGMTAWLAEVANLGAETVLILDEAQAIPASMQASLLYLILNAPSNLHVVMASRRRLRLPLAGLLARGLHAVIGIDRLRFTHQETASILASRFKTGIDAETALALFEKTAGWPLGLQLAIVVIERQDDLAQAVRNLDAASGDLERYFLEELLAGLDSKATDFLVRIAVLDTLHPDLCCVVADRQDAPELLVSLRDQLPIFMEGTATDWMRLHPMVREFLLGRLRKLPADEQQTLHRRSARWLADHGQREAAADHALLAGESEFAYSLISDCLYGAVLEGQQVRVLYWLERLPAAELERHPRVLLGASWALAMSEQHKQAEPLVDKVASNPQAPVEARGESALIGFTAAYFADRIDDAFKIIAPWMDFDAWSSPVLRAIHANCSAIARLYEGKPEQARRAIRAGHSAVPPSMHAVRGWGEWGIGFSYIWEGQVRLAQEFLCEPSRRVDEATGRRNGMSALLASALAMAYWEMGNRDAAGNVLLDRLDVLERVSSPEAIVMGYQVAARIAMSKGQERRSLDLLDNLFALGKMREMPRICVASLIEQARLHMLQGRPDYCLDACKRIEAMAVSLDKSELMGRRLLLRLVQARGYSAIANRDWGAALPLLESFQREVDRLRRGRESIETKLMIALARMHLTQEWESLLNESISLAKIFGLESALSELHPEITELVRLRQTGPTHDQEDKTVLSGERKTLSNGRQVAKASGLLTSKEAEVIRLLNRGLTNKQIASALVISDQTVKWHVKNLFDKLSAGSRKHVVDRARMLGILGDR